MSRVSHSVGMPSRGAIFGLLTLMCVALGVGAVMWARLRSAAPAPVAAPAVAKPAATVAASAPVASGEQRTLLFRSTALDTFGVVATAPVSTTAQTPATAALVCDRVYASAGHGVCLASDRGVLTTYNAIFFGKDFKPTHTFPLSGIPSRTRVAPDGKYAAITVFTSGHSYSPGSFSTETTLYDAASASKIADLEQFEVRKDGDLFRAVDFNFWGITFAHESERFYATLATGGTTYLIEGNVSTRQAHVVYENAECPSLSPDNRRVAFKRLAADHGWQLYVLDLATKQLTPLTAESRSVDDQVEWLDDGTILYSVSDDLSSETPGENIWALPIDGGKPWLFQAHASSPAVVRP